MKKKVKVLNNHYEEIDLEKTKVFFKQVDGKKGEYVLAEPKTAVPVYLHLPSPEKLFLKQALEIFLTTLLKQAHFKGRLRGPSGLKMLSYKDKIIFSPDNGYILHGFAGKLWGDPHFAIVLSVPLCASVGFDRGKITIDFKACSDSGFEDKKVGYVWLLGKPRKIFYDLRQIVRVK